jgi:predicted nuclease of restriction endonuclease-like RecB superfamily
MLTAELVKPRIRMLGSQLSIDLLNIHDASWLQTAADLIALLREQRGQSLASWERTLEMYEGERVDYVVVRGMAKVLTDAAIFTPIVTP